MLSKNRKLLERVIYGIFFFASSVTIISCDSKSGHMVIEANSEENKNTLPPEDTLTFDGEIAAIFENRCANCHGPSGDNIHPADWTDYSTALAAADKIKRRVFVEQSMPLGNATNMTDAERELVAIWVDQGALKTVKSGGNEPIDNPPPSSQPAQEIKLIGGHKDFSVSSVKSQAYWYSRYNLGHLVMRSGMGEQMMPQPEVVQAMLDLANGANAQEIKAQPNETAHLIKRVYNSGNPALTQKFDGNPGHFENFRWKTVAKEELTSTASFGWTLIKEVEWSKQFNVDNHFGDPQNFDPKKDGAANERFAGIVLCAEALQQFQVFVSEPEKFDKSNVANNYVALWGMSNLANHLATPSTELMSLNRCAKTAQMMMGDEAAQIVLSEATTLYQAIKDTPLQSIREMSLAIQALVWYAAATEKNHTAIKSTVQVLTQKIIRYRARNITELSYQLRAMLESSRLFLDPELDSEIARLYNLLQNDFVYEYGIFKSQSVYRVDDIAVILGALNSLRINAGPQMNPDIFKDLNKITTHFFESSINLSQLQMSAPPIMFISEYEREDEMFHRYPTLPLPPMAGGDFGYAPVFANKVIWNGFDKTWSSYKDRFDTAGSMHLANEMIWFHNDQVNGFPNVSLVTITLKDVQSKIFRRKCASCHNNSKNPMGGMNLAGKLDVIYNNLINVLSNGGNGGLAGVPRVTPGESSPQSSYLMAKIIKSDTHRGASPRMPLSGGYLDDGQIDMIRSWIDGGALKE